jgi:hypothetical protein
VISKSLCVYVCLGTRNVTLSMLFATMTTAAWIKYNSDLDNIPFLGECIIKKVSKSEGRH